MRRAPTCLSLLLGLGLLACAGPAPPPPPAPPARPFDAARAWSDLEALVAIGPRPSGSPGAASARAYLRGELEKAGIEVREITLPVPEDAPAPVRGEVVHLVGVIPGRQPDVVLIGASYDSEPKDDFSNAAANAAGSGPAVVLEMARALAADPLLYTTWIVFFDGDEGGAGSAARVGSRLFVQKLEEDGDLQRIRVALVLRQVGDADLRFDRDLNSHRIYREIIWRAARRDNRETFPPDAGFQSPSASHLSFIERGMRRAVAIVDNTYGGTEPPGAFYGTADDTLEHCSAESLGSAGSAALAGIDALTRTLAKVDRVFVATPSEEPPAEESAVQPGEFEAGQGEEPAQGATPDAAPEPAPSAPPDAAPEPAP
jgi:hypothetical protein